MSECKPFKRGKDMNDVRKRWVYPQANVERFLANDYISSCYEVYCYTPDNNSYGDIYEDTNSNGMLDWGDKRVATNVCGDGVSEFTGTYPANNGFWVSGREVKPVFIYHGAKLPGPGHLSIHAADLSDPYNSNAVKDISTLDHHRS